MGKLGGEASTEIAAPIDEVWAAIEDVTEAPDWQEGLKRIEVIDRDSEGRVERANSVSDAKVKDVSSRVRFSYEAPTYMRWEQEKGDLKSVVGEWILEDLGGGRTKATYKLEGDPGRVLGMMIRGPVEGKIREILVESRPGELKARVEGA
ncbi:SRPBCC family protein [Thermoleophilia bacterium SCSIO 60948]|nr:SRPBCC family protein [Thermoleophilia bacterium SCSIO 60948]